MEEITRQTIEEAKGGDIRAFEKIYRAASGFVYTLALRITNSHPEAEEVTQDVFMKIYHNLRGFEFRSAFKTWVYRIAVNTALNARKKASKDIRRREDFDSVIDSQVASDNTQKEMEKLDELKVKKERLEFLLNTLNPEQRSCIMLREIEGLSYQEISQSLNININTVRSRLKRARQALLGGDRECPLQSRG